ncbi:methyltransferase domain-containing protein [Paenibacillus sp. PR3]|uniref:Methyltransferase domain-containing protein n=1 Tax=Paenibacillus terricola TaxID=2763503 RepID=A0ABR8MQ59_9BACL|nr:class I SAM-dependent methyltransferase [Paenibacillus terricola]MBD3918116.1 methyltransferase domain-containing protein [Paenibacillus terricola]
MKQNKYDDQTFFAAYEQMPRSIDGLKAAGEWHVLQAMLPDLQDQRVLDLGCGFGWHCRYALEQQASEVVGVDISDNMLKRARELTDDPRVTYVNSSIEDLNFENGRFDVVISSLAFHYIEAFDDVCSNVYACLAPGGTFVFSVEHPIFTARDEQDWHYDEQGKPLHWPVDRYQSEGMRDTSFLTDNVIKYHRTLSTYMNSLIRAGFRITAVKEPEPSPDMMHIPGMKDELRRPMFLLIAATK